MLHNEKRIEQRANFERGYNFISIFKIIMLHCSVGSWDLLMEERDVLDSRYLAFMNTFKFY